MRTITKKQRMGEPVVANGALNLRIIGFSQQALISIADVVNAIDILPAYHLTGLREIAYEPGSAPIPSYVPGRWGPQSPKAQFIQRQRKIIFYDLGDHNLFRHVLYHEIGHFVFFLAISSVVKKRWVTQIYPGSECVTRYGRFNASEDFAESYAYYLHDETALKKLPAKHAFMRDCIFSGRRETLKEKNSD